jgi:hypothetical protein
MYAKSKSAVKSGDASPSPVLLHASAAAWLERFQTGRLFETRVPCAQKTQRTNKTQLRADPA